MGLKILWALHQGGGKVTDQLIRISTVTPVYSGSEYLGRLVEQLNELKLRLEKECDQLRLAESI